MKKQKKLTGDEQVMKATLEKKANDIEDIQTKIILEQQKYINMLNKHNQNK